METQRLIIRTPELSDAKALLEIRNNEFVLQYNCFPKNDLESLTKMLEKTIASMNDKNIDDDIENETFHMIEKKSNCLIGAFFISKDYLRYKTNSCCIAYYLDEKFTRKGYMKETMNKFLDYLFNEKNYDVVTARAFAVNTASIKLLESTGFTCEGRLRRAVKGYNDIIHDDVIFSMLKSEYNS